MEITSIRPLVAIGVSVLGAALILLSHKRPNQREFWTFLAGTIKFLVVVSMIPVVLAGDTLVFNLVEFYNGIGIGFRVDALGVMFATTASFLWIVTSVYSIGYMRSMNEHAQTRYYACFAITLSAVMGAAFASNILTLYLFYEIITLVTYPLVSHKETPDAFVGAKKYVTYLLGTSKLFLLPALVLTYTVAGTLEFSKGGLFPVAEPLMLTAIYVLFIAGFAKAALMPFHGWLPAAMVAPTPVSALLHAVAVVKVGVFSVVRVVLFIFGVDLLRDLSLGVPTAYIASFTILTASVIAMTKDNLKARLAYSTVSQLSYIILGVVLLSPAGITGGVAHLTNHAFAKITLFFCAGSIYVSSHKTKISEMDGIARKMPYTMIAFAIGVLGMVGVPPAGGFITKWYLVVGSLEADQLIILFVLLTSSILNGAYFLPIVYKAFFKPPMEFEGDHFEEIKENPYIVVPLMITAIISLILGFYPEMILVLVRRVL